MDTGTGKANTKLYSNGRREIDRNQSKGAEKSDEI